MKTNKTTWLPVAFLSITYLGLTTQSVAWETSLVEAVDNSLRMSQAYEAWLEKNNGFIKPSDNKLRQKLTRMQYYVTQEEGTEHPFKNTYWDNEFEGIYVDIVSGEPLFSSTAKYSSGTGWPSFVRPIHENAMITREDRGWFSVRTELRSAMADSHLGHVFEDGPPPTGLRYCINSAALLFIPKKDLVRQGYAEFSTVFD